MTTRQVSPAMSPNRPPPEAHAVQRPVPACPGDMLLVEGSYCDRARQVCSKLAAAYVGHPTRSERCLDYARPTVCDGTRASLRFCIDRFEWPNRAGEKPIVLVSWQEASRLCERAGKRLCDEREWTLACEGEEMLPYVTGYTRPGEECVIDRPYREPRVQLLLPHARCEADARCTRELERIDQRRAATSDSACRSPYGAIDMNGNVNEWVNAEGGRYPHRGALKGGWWGPVRNRCRPAVHRHREDHWGYEIGFRCCRNAEDISATHTPKR